MGTQVATGESAFTKKTRRKIASNGLPISSLRPAVTTTFTFLAYTIPILGGIIADTKWGRFK